MKLFALVSLFAALYSPVTALWPQPRSIQTGHSTLTLAKGFQITVSGSAPSDVQDAITRTKTFLVNDKLSRLVVGRGFGDVKSFAAAKSLSQLTISLESGAVSQPIATEAQKAPEDRNEEYTLTVPADGTHATLTAKTSLGLLRGLTTFGQLWYTYNGTTYSLQTPVTIKDSPAYPYRGFMLDTARNFFPVADIKRTLDAMSWVKLNQFHWHVVDSQSFPLQIPGFTDLADKGAYSSWQQYSPKDVQDIVAYAGARGIDVMVEIDTPGHTSAIAHSNPDFIACPGATPWATYANEPPAGQLRFADDNVSKYIANLFTAVSQLFPSKLFSTGGDELNTKCYDVDAPTQASLKKSGQTLEQALNKFTQTTHNALKAKGKTPVVWEEMVLSHNVSLSTQDTRVLVWISSDNVKAVAEKGFKVIHAASDYFYLDCGHGAWVGDFPTGGSWCDPFKTWQHSYSFNPIANLTASEAKLILGGQHLLWTEQSGPENLDDTVWPRAASSAELFWSGAGGNVTSALPRLHDVSYRFRRRGVKTISLQPEWCAIRPDACDLTA